MATLFVRAVHTFVAEHGDELDFQAGDQIEVLEKDDAFGDGWWRGRNTRGEEGLFPATYISEDPPTPPESVNNGPAAIPASGAAAPINANGTDTPPITGTDFSAPPQGLSGTTPNGGSAAPGAYPEESTTTTTTTTTPGSTTAPTTGNYLSAPSIPIPNESPKGTSDADGGILDSAAGAAAVGVGAAAASVGNVMGKTIGDIQDAIESIGGGTQAGGRAEGVDGGVGAGGAAGAAGVGAGAGAGAGAVGRAIGDASDDEQELGIGQDARAKLVEQARLANEQRDRDDLGFAYSDESEDEDELASPRRTTPGSTSASAPLLTKSSRTSTGTSSPALGAGVNGFHALTPKEEPVVVNPPSPVPAPAPAQPQPAPSQTTTTAAPVFAAGTFPAAPSPTAFDRSPGSLEPAFSPSTPPLGQGQQTPTGQGLGGAGYTPQQNQQQQQQGVTSSSSNRSSSIPAKPATTWSVDDVVAWAQAKGFDDAICEKFREHEITGDVLLELDANLLKELDIPAFGKRMRIASAISELRRPSSMISSSSQQLSPSGLPLGMSSNLSMRGMSAPPQAYSQGGQGQPFPSTPPLSTPPTSAHTDDGAGYSAWAHGRKTSGHGHGLAPPMEAINENQQAQAAQRQSAPTPSAPASTASRTTASGTAATATTAATTATRTGSTTAPSSVPASPVTPGSAGIAKRSSSGSMGHKRGKASVDSKERLSFFGRARKAPPSATSPSQENGQRSASSRLGFTGAGGRGEKVHQMQAATPEASKRISGPVGAGAAGTATTISAAGQSTALAQIGTPDYAGTLKKKGERYGGWKTRYVVLKGSSLYVLADQHAEKLKGRIDLHSHRVMVDENAHPGSYGFRLAGTGAAGGDKTHFFSSSEQATVRAWMKALLKATISRDYAVPVTSSCNIPTIPLAEAQAMAPRPPSPATREATQRATRRENPNQLTAHDATILTSLDTSSGEKRRASNLGVGGPSPARPSRDMRRPSSNFSVNTTRPISGVIGGAAVPVTSRGSGGARPAAQSQSNSFFSPDEASHAPLIEWVNARLPTIYPRATALPASFISGEVIFLLVKHLSGVEPSPPVPPHAFAPEADGQPGLDGLIAMMDMLVDAGVGIDGVSINDVRVGDSGAIVRLLKDVKEWYEQWERTAA
ncbi:hypothetical protein IAT38_002163 [Cryptococcus sp. DSM 104549]